MNELIKITEKNNQRVVDARELHTFLQSQQQFADWIKNRIEKYGFIENQDFIRFHKIMKPEKGRGNKNLIEYALSLDMAKELGMIENNEQGRLIRQYFIAIEKERKLTLAVPETFAEALELAARQQRAIEGQRHEIAKLKPKAEYVERSMESEGLIEMSMVAKVIGLPYGRNILFKILRKTGVFFMSRNEPLQKYVDAGYFTIKQKVITRKSYPNLVVHVPFTTQKGIVKLSAWLSQRGYFDEQKVISFLKQE